MTQPFVTIPEAIEDLKQGRMVILVDDEDRENEGDLIMAAEFVQGDDINFMSKHARGLICLPMSPEYIDRLNLPLMAKDNRSPFKTAFTTSIEAAQGVTTGISAQDRATTIRVAIDDKTRPEDIITPGHIFPLRAKPKGVLERTGQTEGSVDLMRLAGLKPAAVICEIMNEDGTMSRREELALFSSQHKISMVTVQDLVKYRIQNECLVEAIAESRLPLKHQGEFDMTVFTNQLDDFEHFSLTKNPIYAKQVPLVRIHSECITGDVFGSNRCDCGSQLAQSLDLISEEGGVLIYLRQEGRGIGLANKLKAYALQDKGFDTVDANVKLGLPVDGRAYDVAYQILKYLGIDVIKLLTNNPCKVAALTQYGMTVSERIPLHIKPTHENIAYLKAKKEKLGHLLAVESMELSS